MDINQIRELLTPFVQVFSALIVGGGTVAVATQLLKLDWFPVAVSKYPRLTSALLSVVASFVTIYVSGIDLVLVTPFDYIGFMVGTLILAAVTYKAVLKGTVPGRDDNSAKL